MEELLCPLCEDTLKYSVILSCSHNLCYSCTDSLINSFGSKSKEVILTQIKMLKCPMCPKFSILNEISVSSLPRNSTLSQIISAEQTSDKCQCGDQAFQECISCECLVCKVCARHHETHCLIPAVDKCAEHSLEKVFYCENDKDAYCAVCSREHILSRHCVMHKDDILVKYWHTLQDIRLNREEMIAISSRLPNDLPRDFYEILKKCPESWIESINQVIGIRNLLEQSCNPSDISNLLSQQESIFRLAVESLSLLPANNHEFSVIPYISRGNKDIISYDFSTTTYKSVKTDKIIVKWSGLTQISDTILLVTGGKPAKDQGAISDCYRLNIHTGEFAPTQGMKSAHSSHTALLFNDLVFVISGKNETNVASVLCECFDLSTGAWSSIPSNLQGRTCASGTVCNNSIYIIGGCKNNTIERYYIETQFWELLQVTLPDYKWQHSSLAVGNRVLVFGGQGVNEEPSRTSYYFDPDNLRFEDFQVMPVKNSWLCSWYPVLRRGNCVWVMNKESKLLCFNTTTGTWSLYTRKISA